MRGSCWILRSTKGTVVGVFSIVAGIAENSGRVANYDRPIRYILSNNTAGANRGPFTDRDAAQDGCSRTDGSTAFDCSGNAAPVRFRLQLTFVGRCSRVAVVNEGDVMTNEDLIFDGNPFTNE